MKRRTDETQPTARDRIRELEADAALQEAATRRLEVRAALRKSALSLVLDADSTLDAEAAVERASVLLTFLEGV